jgi:hypothetical protein
MNASNFCRDKANNRKSEWSLTMQQALWITFFRPLEGIKM